MDKEDFKKTLALVRKHSPKRKFTQTVDLIVNLKDINLKNPAQQVDVFVPIQHAMKKPFKVCGLVGPELATQAKEVFDFSQQTRKQSRNWLAIMSSLWHKLISCLMWQRPLAVSWALEARCPIPKQDVLCRLMLISNHCLSACEIPFVSRQKYSLQYRSELAMKA